MIDFMDELEGMGFRVKVPREVLEEMKDLRRERKTSQQERVMINVALEMLSDKKIKKTRLGDMKVDEGLITVIDVHHPAAA